MRSRVSSTWMLSPFLHKAHGDHMSPSSLQLPYCLHYSFTDNKPIVLPLLSTPLSQFSLPRKQKNLLTLLIVLAHLTRGITQLLKTLTIATLFPRVKGIKN